MATVFDGSSGFYRDQNLRNISSSGKGTLQVWGKISADAAVTDTILYAAGSNTILWLSWFANNLYLQLYDGGSLDLQLVSTTDWVSTDGYVAYTMSWDLANGLYYMYRGNTDDTTLGNSPSATTVAYADATQWEIGGVNLSSSPAHTLTGTLASIAFWPGVYVDLTTENERRNLISNDGKPIGLGPDASGRGGRSSIDQEAIIFFSSAFVKNIGTGGAFSTLGSPSYERGPDAYRQSADRLTYGVRWYDSDRSGWSYPRNEMLRERTGKKGQRVGFDESDEADRDDFREVDFNDLIDGEEDHEDVL